MTMVRVAAVQMKVTKNTDENVSRMLRWLEKAKARKADIVCFPETSVIANHAKVSDIRPYLKKIHDACKKNSIFCVFTSYERKGRHVYNAGYIVDSTGRTIHKYAKVNLWGIEKKYIRPGRFAGIVKTKHGNLGMIICADFAHPQHVAKLKKADIIFCPSFMIDYEGAEEIIRSFPLVRAFDNLSYFVFCDAYSKRTSRMTAIAEPLRVLKRVDRGEKMILADLSLKKIRNFRSKIRKMRS